MNALCSGADAQLNNTTAAAVAVAAVAVAAPVTYDTAVATIGAILNMGAKARLVVLSNGLAIEVMDGGGTWQRQVAWTE